MPFAVTWMGLEIIILSKPERQIMILLTYGILKNDTNGLLEEYTHRHKNKLMVTKKGRDNLEVED